MLGYKCRGIAHLHAGDTTLAIADFSQAIRINPKSGSALASRGRAYQGRGDLDSAMTDVDESIRAEPNGPNTYLSYYYVLRLNR